MTNWPNVLRVISLFGEKTFRLVDSLTPLSLFSSAKDSTGTAAVESREDDSGDAELPRLVRIDTNGLAQGGN